MNTFRRAARAARRRLAAQRPGPGAEIERASVEVQLEGESEIVSFGLRGDALVWSCTCGQLECAHAAAALDLLGVAGDSDPAPAEPPHQGRITEVWEPPVAAPVDLRTVEHSDRAAGADTAGLAEALQDLLVAVVRAGVGAGSSPALDEALQRLVRAAPDPLPLGISRWVGRLKRALGARDSEAVARLLAGAALLLEHLDHKDGSAAARQRVLSWLGSLSHETEGVLRISDRTLIEVAREELPGIERGSIERRYLVDLGDGTVYREERAPNTNTASLGPCPRVLTVWLAEVEQGAAPPRIRLLQYAVTPVIEAETWQKLAAYAARDFEAVLEGYRAEVREFPGLCEPFALIAPAGVVHAGSPQLVDERGRVLHLHDPDNPAVLRYFESVTRDVTPAWVAGRLHDRAGVLSMAPLGAGLARASGYDYAQM